MSVRKTILHLLLLTALLLSAACSKDAVSSVRLIPADAVLIVRIDATKMKSLAGSDAGWQILTDKAREHLRQSDISIGLRRRLTDIIGDPEASGADLEQPLYLFLTKSRELALIGNIGSKSDFDRLLEALATDSGCEVSESDGFSMLSLDDGTTFLANDDIFYIGRRRDGNATGSLLSQRLETESDLSAFNPFELMSQREGIAQLLMAAPIAAQRGADSSAENDTIEAPSGAVRGASSSGAVGGVIGEGGAPLLLLADLSVGCGETIARVETIALTDEWQTRLDDAERQMRPLGREHARYISGEGLSVLINIVPEHVYEWVEQLLTAADITDESTLSEAKLTCEDLDGSAALEFPNLSDSLPHFVLCLGSRSERVVETIIEVAADEDMFINTGEGQYCAPISYNYNRDDLTRTPATWAWFGQYGGITYVTTDSVRVPSDPPVPYPTNDIHGRGFYARCPFALLAPLADSLSGFRAEAVERLGSLPGHAEAYYDGDNIYVIRLVTPDRERTLIELFCDAD